VTDSFSVGCWAVFPQNWAVFSLRCGKFFAVGGCVFWASFIKVHAFFWAVFAKYFSIKEYILKKIFLSGSFCRFC